MGQNWGNALRAMASLVLLVLLPGCSPPDVRGGVLSIDDDGISFINFVGGVKTPMVPWRGPGPSGTCPYTAADYDVDNETLYYADVQAKTVNAWTSGENGPRPLCIIPSEGSSDCFVGNVLLSRDKKTLVVGSMPILICSIDGNANKPRQVAIPGATSCRIEGWTSNSQCLIAVSKPSGKPADPVIGVRPHETTAMYLDVSTVELSPAPLAAACQWLAKVSCDERSLLVLEESPPAMSVHELPSGKLTKRLPQRGIYSNREFTITDFAPIDDENFIFTGRLHCCPSEGLFLNWQPGLYVCNSRLGAAARISVYAPLEIVYLPRPPRWRPGREGR